MAPKKLNAVQSKNLVPGLKEFNKLADVFVRMLQRRVAAKEKRIQSIRVLVSDMARPAEKPGFNIRTLDINTSSKAPKKGPGFFKRLINWEDDMMDSGRSGSNTIV